VSCRAPPRRIPARSGGPQKWTSSRACDSMS
jgi:hypothetical protein